ncbi:riboflavin kinase [Conexibacter sp. CPCC 206217]|uniref:riboflavin kinase n=1 Tax=Conexibacter sp. CPCC 206217 TaxID=3064574 RepID=UPI00271B152E|nr:riboflavin kinase [Conexibacter sp. CPCC 206217]MDO8208910.1 riboflavin kinase [Conexibacter sp. CPCC 206217]
MTRSAPPGAMRPHGAITTVEGVVVEGLRLGRQLGFPTANVRLAEDGPAHGVYAGCVLDHAAAINIGVRPTIGDRLEPLAEAYLLDFEGDLYGRRIVIELIQLLRPEQRFDSVEQLTAQIARDVAAVRALCARR